MYLKQITLSTVKKVLEYKVIIKCRAKKNKKQKNKKTNLLLQTSIAHERERGKQLNIIEQRCFEIILPEIENVLNYLWFE